MTDYADVAADALRWVASQAVDAPGGSAWTDNGVVADDLYVGTAGVLLATAEAFRYGVDCTPLAASARGRLFHVADAVTGDLFEGAAGRLVALRAWSRSADDPAAGAAADRLAAAISEWACRPADAGRYYDVISGDAGTLIALLPEDLGVVGRALEALASRLDAAAERSDLGLHWTMSPGEDRLMPGFSHGTAGVAYALLLTGQALARPDLVELAAEAGHSLIRLATTSDGWVLPNRFPPKSLPPAVSFGWCHGPAGTVRLFAALAEIAPDPAWQQAISACLQALRDSGLPARRYPGFWDNVGRCCGTAGVGLMLLDRHAVTGDRELLDWSAALADDVISYAITDDEGTRWSNHEHTVDPPDLPPGAGLMQGAAGIAGWLARLAAAQARRAGRSETCF
ncbi:hypothetical protein acdb102_20390 [Acidothermaceae bacterium B102]|nr:hypothetical protein acdb102_20390 [Acidothermaceae bacterium B102]